MNGGLAAVALVLILLMRPWQLPDRMNRELSALAAAVMLGLLFLRLCLPA
jgi:formate-dependent nitrite reductase membrane component NrfD